MSPSPIATSPSCVCVSQVKPEPPFRPAHECPLLLAGPQPRGRAEVRVRPSGALRPSALAGCGAVLMGQG